jgi:hypothetical protein
LAEVVVKRVRDDSQTLSVLMFLSSHESHSISNFALVEMKVSRSSSHRPSRALLKHSPLSRHIFRNGVIPWWESD